MILIQIVATIIIVLYWLVVPAALVHVWAECRTIEDSPIPFKEVLKGANWVGIFWWFLIGLLFTGGLIELWKI